MKTWDETFYNNSSRLNSHKAGKEMRANGRGVEALGFKCLCVCLCVCVRAVLNLQLSLLASSTQFLKSILS